MSETNVRFVGLDVHKRVIECCILAEDGRVLKRDRWALSRDYLESVARAVLQATDRVALEATTNTWAVADVLRPFVAEVIVSNPMTTKAIASAKVKTDKVDAAVLAHLLRLDYLPRVWQPDDVTRQLRSLCARRASLVSDRTRIKNRLHAVLAQRLITPQKEKLFTADGLAWLAAVELDELGRKFVDSDLRLLGDIERELAELQPLLAQHAHRETSIKLLMTLPGVDVAVAASLVAAIGDIERFREADQVAGYLGLAPSTYQSADHCYHGPITKAGRSHTRWMLVQAAHHVAKHPGPLGVFFRRLAAKKNYNVAVVATARKLAVIAWHMLKHREPYRYAQPRPTETKLARLRVQATGRKRRTGPAKGTPNSAKGTNSPTGKKAAPENFPGGSRTIKPLAQVYQEESLPPLRNTRPGERQMLSRTGTVRFAESLNVPHRIPRRQKTTPSAPQ